ncbi:alpha-mannosidase [Lasius niger]|uniref:Alpha-mannosidase n=1 Tax=Lasius niger TaxID=67767 RepID=A0A0J7K422_LASNI|nr:alpha-mannosidase [Lasius niger]
MEGDKVRPKGDERPVPSGTETGPEKRDTETDQRETGISDEDAMQIGEEHCCPASQIIHEEMDVQPDVDDQGEQQLRAD